MSVKKEQISKLKELHEVMEFIISEMRRPSIDKDRQMELNVYFYEVSELLDGIDLILGRVEWMRSKAGL